MEPILRSTKLATLSLIGLSAIYVIALIWTLYISIIVGKLQDIFATVLWLSLVLWCARSLHRRSNKARKWSIFLFALHGFISIFYIIFPMDFGSMHGIFTIVFIFVFITSCFGIFHAIKARSELFSRNSESSIEATD